MRFRRTITSTRKMNSTLDPSIQSEVRNHLWNYFALHAQQRMNAFQFFITLETALVGAVLLIIQSKSSESAWYAIAGGMISLLAFIFWKIDQRTRDLIKNAEISLRELETYLMTAQLVSSFPFTTDPQAKGSMSAFPLISGRLSYAKSFGVVFFCCGVLGLVLSVALIWHPKQ